MYLCYMEEILISIKNNAVSLILDAKTEEEIEELKLQFLGRNGTLTNFMKKIPALAQEEKSSIGRLANETKKIIEDSLESASRIKKEDKKQEFKKIDVTDPGIKPSLGHLHPVTEAIDEIVAIFKNLGFSRARYPEIEWDYYAFEALNFPPNHPARDDWETFFVEQEPDKKFGPVVLTPHTSNGQIREMERIVKSNPQKISIRMLNLAKTYRRQSDVSHTPMFHQFEGLVVDKNIAITHLKGTLDFFAKSYFGEERTTRIRPYHFQFTEPSFEVDISCGICSGRGCKLCKAGWLELGGAGMVHPNVLKYCQIDPEKYTGFAFGFGVERALMMKSGIEIDDLRLLYSNKTDFLKQF